MRAPSRPVPADRLEDLVVVVTGASSGIGRATCRALVERGAHVTALARREAALASLRDELSDGPGSLAIHPGDIADPEVARWAARDAVERHGHLDAWVNNAAVNLYGPLDAGSDDDPIRVLQVNLVGYLNGIRAALPHFRERGRGTVVNVSSVLGHLPSPFQGAYVASKHAIHGLTGTLRQEVAEDGIDVCEVVPGPVDTPLFAEAANHMGRSITPPDPIASPERVAHLILASLVRARRTRVVGFSNRLLLSAARHAPRLTELASARVMRREHFGTAPTFATSGNLYEPSETSAQVAGGWTERGPRRRALVALGVALATTTVLLRRTTGGDLPR